MLLALLAVRCMCTGLSGPPNCELHSESGSVSANAERLRGLRGKSGQTRTRCLQRKAHESYRPPAAASQEKDTSILDALRSTTLGLLRPFISPDSGFGSSLLAMFGAAGCFLVGTSTARALALVGRARQSWLTAEDKGNAQTLRIAAVGAAPPAYVTATQPDAEHVAAEQFQIPAFAAPIYTKRGSSKPSSATPSETPRRKPTKKLVPNPRDPTKWIYVPIVERPEPIAPVYPTAATQETQTGGGSDNVKESLRRLNAVAARCQHLEQRKAAYEAACRRSQERLVVPVRVN